MSNENETLNKMIEEKCISFTKHSEEAIKKIIEENLQEACAIINHNKKYLKDAQRRR